MQRLSQPDAQRVHTAAAKRTSIVDERRRRVGGNAPRWGKASSERQHKTTAVGEPRLARHVQSARRAEVKMHPRASHKPRPPSKPQGHPRASTAPRGARRTKSARPATRAPKVVTATHSPDLATDGDTVGESALPLYPGETGNVFDDQRIKSEREVQDTEIAQMRADEDGHLRAERTSGLDSGNTADELSSVLRFVPDIDKADNPAYAFSDGQLKATRPPNGRVALCTGTEIKGSQTCAAFTIVQSKVDRQLLLGVAERSIDVEKDVAPATNRFWGISSLDGSIVSSGWHARWEGQQGFCAGDTVELLVLAAAGNIAVKKNDELLGVAAIPGVLPSADDLCWAVSLSDEFDVVTARKTDASQFETKASSGPTVSTSELSRMHLRLDLLEAQLTKRKQRRQDQARELHDIHKRIKERESCKAERAKATEPKALTKGTSRMDTAAVVRKPTDSRFGGPVATLGTSTRSGIGSINGGRNQIARTAANDAVFAKLKQLQSVSAKLTSESSKPAPDFRVLRSRAPLPDGFVLVSPELAEIHKSALVHSLALQTSGTWHSAEIADGFRIVNVANSSRGQKGWARLSEAAEETIEQAVFSTIVAAAATDRRAAAARHASTGSDPVAATSDMVHSIQRTDLQRYAPYHFGEGVICSHSPYGTTLSDVWYSCEDDSPPTSGKGLSLGDWDELLRVVKRRLGGYVYRAFLVGLAWETGATRRLRQACTDLDGVPGRNRESPLKDGVYPVVHAIFDQGNAGERAATAPDNPVVALKVCVLESAAVAVQTLE